MKKLILLLLCYLVAIGCPAAETRTDTLVVNNGKRQLFGILNRPDTSSTAKLPIAIIAHGFNGDHRYGRNYFKPLAKAGYMCYTFDFPCGALRSAIDNNTVNMSIVDEVSDMKAAVEYFSKRPEVHPQWDYYRSFRPARPCGAGSEIAGRKINRYYLADFLELV